MIKHDIPYRGPSTGWYAVWRCKKYNTQHFSPVDGYILKFPKINLYGIKLLRLQAIIYISTNMGCIHMNEWNRRCVPTSMSEYVIQLCLLNDIDGWVSNRAWLIECQRLRTGQPPYWIRILVPLPHLQKKYIWLTAILLIQFYALGTPCKTRSYF